MNRNTIRLTLAVVAIFYTIVGGLWATSYFPLQKMYKQQKIQSEIILNSSDHGWSNTEAYKKAEEYNELYHLTHPDVFVTEGRISLYQSILLWGTVALSVGAAVLFLTRPKRVA